jgi:ParB family chromosome partitioning protein
MSSRPNALGRGIGALLPGAEALAAAAPELVQPESAQPPPELPVDAIEPNPEQPRRVFEEEPLAQLVASIRQHGVLQPVVVRRAGDGYQLVVGERRWRAAREAGLEAIPAVVADVAPRERLELALVENVQRSDLNPIELAHAFRELSDHGHTQEEIGERVSLDRSTIANHLRLLELPGEIQTDVETGRLSMGHAKALLQVSNPERRRHLRDRIVNQGLPVRAAEELARKAGSPRPARSRGGRAAADPNLQRVVDSLRQRLQTRVRIQGDGGRGRIEIEYFGTEDLQRITELLLGDG